MVSNKRYEGLAGNREPCLSREPASFAARRGIIVHFVSSHICFLFFKFLLVVCVGIPEEEGCSRLSASRKLSNFMINLTILKYWKERSPSGVKWMSRIYIATPTSLGLRLLFCCCHFVLGNSHEHLEWPS